MIICLGTTPALQRSMTFDRLAIGAVNRAVRSRHYASGKSINAARVIATLGHAVLATGFLGGASGALIHRELERDHIKNDFVDVSPATRTCVTAIDAAARTATELVEEAVHVEAALYDQLLHRLERHLGTASVLVLSGSLPSGAPPGFYEACVKLAAAAHVEVVLDAKGPELLAALPRHPRLIKPNRDELGKTLDLKLKDDPSTLAAMRQLIASGARQVIVTDGPRPVLCADAKSAWRLTPPKIQPVSAIGSGDALAAGVAIAIDQGMDLVAATTLGIACAAANALTPDAGHLDPADVKRLQAQIATEPL
jgi:tagatose 6-phosphate kinase